MQSLRTVTLHVGQLPKGRSHLSLWAIEQHSKSPPPLGEEPQPPPGKLRTCLLAGTGCDTAAFAQREDEKHGPCVPSPTGASRKSTSSSPASFIFTFRNRLSFQYVDKRPRSG